MKSKSSDKVDFRKLNSYRLPVLDIAAGTR